MEYEFLALCRAQVGMRAGNEHNEQQEGGTSDNNKLETGEAMSIEAVWHPGNKSLLVIAGTGNNSLLVIAGTGNKSRLHVNKTGRLNQNKSQAGYVDICSVNDSMLVHLICVSHQLKRQP